MADLSQTAANFAIESLGAELEMVTGGEVIVPGNSVRLNTTTKRWIKADSNASFTDIALAVTRCAGDGNRFAIVRTDNVDINLGATLVPGTCYVISDTAGNICPDTDVGATETFYELGRAASSSLLRTNFRVPGITL